MTASCQTRLTDTDKNVLAKAHRLADAHGRQVAEVVGTDTADIALVYAESFGVAQVLLHELALIVRRLDGAQ